mmetsp:Transcript_7355/g.16652  ORF Transcript_7355/g.16652 Transcript_7355/m.16652 type:complete len:475 (+) Transcript_7355:160-1584(+)|eukprot:CAMPEP_0206438006 /NCGR_PEP_ID=MMETSP0324_2-20121206/11364_1 /ASSEMBLY_ACC=CAM_ASM_000836 /TAXON_ID=2866 /ORGANISM="Crypthecodinium cohnii, Strain Seligo" /LENGTH=474 /DNA_ID=CAMNT_0053905365 /DNA_START=90 /DNA_END=1514 /DNA_ORIENTATION=-
MAQESAFSKVIDVPGLESKDLNLALALAPALQSTFSEDCSRFSSSCRGLMKYTDQFLAKLGHFLFGPECTTDITETIRQSVIGQWNWLVGEETQAANKPQIHAKLSAEHIGGKFSIDVEHFSDEAMATAGPVSPEGLFEVDDVRVSAHHLFIDAEGGAEGSDSVSVGCSDLGVEVATGSHPDLISEWLEQGWRCSKVFAWLAADYGHPTVLKARIQETFQNTVGVAQRFLKWPEVKFSKKLVNPRTHEVTMRLPVNLAEAEKHYPRCADLLRLIDLLKATTRSAGGKSTICEITFKDHVLEASFYIRDGELAYREEAGGLVEWDKEGQLVVETTVDCCLLPLGSSAVAIPIPHMTLKSVMERRGRLEVSCIDAGEPEFKMAADTIFDTALFRRQLLEFFGLQIEHFPSGPSDRAYLRMTGRLVFPTSTIATIISQWFYSFALQQLRDDDGIRLLSDLVAALAMDSTRIVAASAI